jgi:hypothetical protein
MATPAWKNLKVCKWRSSSLILPSDPGPRQPAARQSSILRLAAHSTQHQPPVSRDDRYTCAWDTEYVAICVAAAPAVPTPCSSVPAACCLPCNRFAETAAGTSLCVCITAGDLHVLLSTTAEAKRRALAGLTLSFTAGLQLMTPFSDMCYTLLLLFPAAHAARAGRVQAPVS